MGRSPFEILQRQEESALCSKREPAAAKLCREPSLIVQVQRMAVRGSQSAEPPEQNAVETESLVCADGYQRRSPVQPYRCPQDGDLRRRVWGWCAAALLAVLLVLAVWYSGLLHW